MAAVQSFLSKVYLHMIEVQPKMTKVQSFLHELHVKIDKLHSFVTLDAVFKFGFLKPNFKHRVYELVLYIKNLNRSVV